jgi:sterol desaturase/sphingolipid hydroxylase (fatty acid hydroxylase superfamily)
MQSVINYFSNVPDSHRIILLGASMLIFWNIENIYAISLNYRKWKHALINTLFIFPDALVQFALGIIVVKTISWDATHHWGLLNWIPGLSNPLYQFIISFIILDFFEYVYHRAMHKVKRQWMFHLVHHSDMVVDVSTTLREHPGETFIRLSFLVIWIFISGVGFWMLLLRQFIEIVSNVFAHSNFRIPGKVNSIVGLIFITPNIHHVHHHYKLPYTDCNYGDVLSIWDRIFGTFNKMSKEEVNFGIDSFMDEQKTENVTQLAIIPFGKYLSSPMLPLKSISYK